MCDCYVRHLTEETRFSLHYGAHNPTCPAYRVSHDPVDRAHDEAFRAQAEIERPAEIEASKYAPLDNREIAGDVRHVTANARSYGFTHVKTRAGLVALEDWTPYGKRRGHLAIDFVFNPSQMSICEQTRKGYVTGPATLTGIWGLS